MKLQPKVIVAHPARQHSFRLASALKKEQMLYKYITTIYNSDRSVLMRVVNLFLSNDNRKRAKGRKNIDLAESDIMLFCELRGYIETFLERFDKSRLVYEWWRKGTSKKFGKKVAKYAIQEKVDVVIMYDMTALECFHYLEKHAPHIVRILDTSAANRVFMKEIYEQDRLISPDFSYLLEREVGFVFDRKKLEYFRQENYLATEFIVGSDFVKQSLVFQNIESKRIHVCPYGVDHNLFRCKEYLTSEQRPLEFVYVGGTKQMKGISYLLDAFTQVDVNKARLTVVGKVTLNNEQYLKYSKVVNFTGLILNQEVSRILRSSDVFVFASLGEGMSLSVLEAMAVGLPVITTENSGTSEIITDGVNGFVIPIQSVSSIKKAIEWCCLNRDTLNIIGLNARETSEKFTWDYYEANVSGIVANIIQSIEKQ